MKAWLFAAAALLAVGALAPTAFAEGPRPSSENHWPGISEPAVDAGRFAPAPQAAATAAPHYVWQEGYEHGGRWHGRWVLVQ